jgi:hypothetical protein
MKESVKIKLSTYLELNSRPTKNDEDFKNKRIQDLQLKINVFEEFLNESIQLTLENSDGNIKKCFNEFVKRKHYVDYFI